jgi:hypothetical protein
MRSVLLVLIAAVTFFISNAQDAQAEQQMFVILSNADGYGVDRCLEDGSKCGAAVAAAYCRARDYAKVASFRRVDQGEITGAVPTTTGSAARNEFVAIECLR